jgi:hypothetical protein
MAGFDIVDPANPCHLCSAAAGAPAWTDWRVTAETVGGVAEKCPRAKTTREFQ